MLHGFLQCTFPICLIFILLYDITYLVLLNSHISVLAWADKPKPERGGQTQEARRLVSQPLMLHLVVNILVLESDGLDRGTSVYH